MIGAIINAGKAIKTIGKGVQGWKDGKGKGLKGRLKGVADNFSGEKQDDTFEEILSNLEEIKINTSGSNTNNKPIVEENLSSPVGAPPSLGENNFGEFNKIGETLSATGEQGDVIPAIGTGNTTRIVPN